MKFIFNLIILTFIISCSKNEMSLNEYLKYPVKFGKQKIIYPNNEFSILIPKYWKWKIEDYDNENIIFGIDAISKPDKDRFMNSISIQKVKSFTNNENEKDEFEYYINLMNKNWKLADNGKTEIFEKKGYYYHFKQKNETYGALEMYIFITKSETKNVFYLLTASVSKTKDFDMQMAIAIQCIQTFKNEKME